MIPFAEWLLELRRLHEKARAGTLDEVGKRRYRAARDQLVHSLLVAQQVTRESGHARQSVRVAWALQVDLATRPSTRAVTLDLSVGGFSTLLGTSPKHGTELEFSLRLPGGAAPISGTARVVATIASPGTVRVSFAFSELAPADRERLEMALFDRIFAALTRGDLPPRKSNPR